jgi:hypothetical protein
LQREFVDGVLLDVNEAEGQCRTVDQVDQDAVADIGLPEVVKGVSGPTLESR